MPGRNSYQTQTTTLSGVRLIMALTSIICLCRGATDRDTNQTGIKSALSTLNEQAESFGWVVNVLCAKYNF